MRYIDIDELVLPDGWLEKAATASTAVAAGAKPDDFSNVWRELKDALADLFPNKKCWYCESPVDRADNAVDHFRPKGKVSDAARPHNGYRWSLLLHTPYRVEPSLGNRPRSSAAHSL